LILKGPDIDIEGSNCIGLAYTYWVRLVWYQNIELNSTLFGLVHAGYITYQMASMLKMVSETQDRKFQLASGLLVQFGSDFKINWKFGICWVVEDFIVLSIIFLFTIP